MFHMYRQLKGLNLTGSLPVEFANLSHLRDMALLGNRISGTIPKEIGDIATLEELVLEDNLLEGNLPANLGSLSNLRRLCADITDLPCSLLSANNFNGTIPVTFGNLRNLTDFRIDGSRMSGRIPDFIGNWNKLERLDLQGTSMEGPIPATISRLKNLTDLRISDLKGPSMSFPNLQNMNDMEDLILRNCSIIGPIPVYLGEMKKIRTLFKYETFLCRDLSFNMLNGQIPNSLQQLSKLDYLFLAHNSLTGEVPGWILDSREHMDLSYNNFTRSRTAGCQFSNVNLVASHSTSASNSTGVYMGNDNGRFIATNVSSMASTGAEFYQTARLSPSSLKYFGLCLRKGSYKVRLHFAEIMYSDDATFSSLGRRKFDVSIQGQVVLTDFDIVREANGVRKGIYRDFNVYVNGSTLEIHLYWTGKGTTAIPDRGVYGPLISAIAVTPNFDVSTGLSVGAITGIVISSCVFVLLILAVVWMKVYRRGKAGEDSELRGLDLQTGYFTLRQIKAATNNFDNANKIGEGGFGPVYKGVLSDGTVIAVKQLSSKSKQGNREFVNEIGMISALQHPNLVKLFGCCIEGNQLLLIYEYLENNCLARALFGRQEQRLNLDWQTRKKICLGIARGLAYLHEESRGYMAPEYTMRGYLTDKADVYSFGIVALEIVSGKSNTNYRPKEEFVYLLDWAYVLQEQGNLLELVDSQKLDGRGDADAKFGAFVR
ncbi:UNVERIFIED_CONTAM: putative LRR receptor-like serine/threonine-protein kinase [Sesamum radiatum]|uniref:non-specific serine/threonine protein kinase n=1 Tax=Sesamum radiatum TaxID=300843 RepID=A0AAW2K4Y8_SESRA